MPKTPSTPSPVQFLWDHRTPVSQIPTTELDRAWFLFFRVAQLEKWEKYQNTILMVSVLPLAAFALNPTPANASLEIATLGLVIAFLALRIQIQIRKANYLAHMGRQFRQFQKSPH